MSDLLSILDDIEAEELGLVWHLITPNMAAACGTVATCGGSCGGGCPPQSPRHHFTLSRAETTCPLCLSAAAVTR